MTGREWHTGDNRRQWLREIREYMDTAVSFETMGMFAANLLEFILSIYEAKRLVKRIGERVIITQWGRNTFEAHA